LLSFPFRLASLAATACFAILDRSAEVSFWARALAAFRAIADRSAFDKALALAFPPMLCNSAAVIGFLIISSLPPHHAF
jgi:hypothetical protein